ncbi:unnamed protein product [Acanthoscelides obtectus]|uniref:Uncharacterized protein n=1 Tax=Acanthoscelides obtectus TaxID=200917 RepID=A0A9P0VSB4_ACAOB|nr:unnamed protein product [Acanthoscelides obtectus]CAK1658917.1 hypothetical protein AOBTE_LOCUS21202 [Acanthoscelides obtectus]
MKKIRFTYLRSLGKMVKWKVKLPIFSILTIFSLTFNHGVAREPLCNIYNCRSPFKCDEEKINVISTRLQLRMEVRTVTKIRVNHLSSATPRLTSVTWFQMLQQQSHCATIIIVRRLSNVTTRRINVTIFRPKPMIQDRLATNTRATNLSDAT